MYKGKTLEEIIQEHTNRVIGARKAYETKQAQLRAEQFEAMKALNQTTLQQIYDSFDEWKSTEDFD